MKIVAIIGSPKTRGSGYRVVKMIEEAMTALGGAEFEYLFLKEANLKPCTGCYLCMARGEEKCPLKDDRAAIEKMLLQADGIILSSPMYVRNVSGLMKNFMDRFAYSDHRPLFYRQRMLIVANTGGGNPKPTLKVLENALGGARIVHRLGVLTPPWPQTQRAVARKERGIEIAARKLHAACLEHSLPVPTFERYVHYLLMQKLSVACARFFPADHAYYQGEVAYLEAGMNPVKLAGAKLIAEIGKRLFILTGRGPGDISWPAAQKTAPERCTGADEA